MLLNLFAGPFVASMMGVERAKALVSLDAPDWSGELQSKLDDLLLECRLLPIDEAFRDRVKRLRERGADTRYYQTRAALATAIHELQIDFLNELGATMFLALHPAAAGRWKNPEGDWSQAALAKFPIGQDARAATRCIALGEWTASVFHSMRVMEHGLRWLADRLPVPFSIPFEYQQWHNVIEAIEGKIRRREQQMAKGDAKSDEITFYSKAASHFFFVKEAWRNHVAHSRTTYDEGEATRVLNDVREFMAQLAERA